MEKLKIALLQIMPEGSMDNNLKKGIDACRRISGIPLSERTGENKLMKGKNGNGSKSLNQLRDLR